MWRHFASASKKMMTSNIHAVTSSLIAKINNAGGNEAGADKLLRSLALATAGNMAYRIHKEGKNANGANIGTYSPEYMKVRTGRYATNKKFIKGKKEGETKPTGVFTKGINKGSKRPSYNRTDDTNMIFSLTRQMENDFGLIGSSDPIKTANGYGVGFKNPFNAQKADWLTVSGAGRNKKTFPDVYKLSESEKQSIRNIAADFVANALQTR